MEIMGLQKTSMIDMPGCVSCVIFCQGCNRHCAYCHNPESISKTAGTIKWKGVKEFLTKRKNILDAVIFSGGEPTLQKDLLSKISYCKKLGYKIGLHTNGEGSTFQQVASYCDYILLSHPNDKKYEIAKQAKKLQFSKVIKNEKNEWYNKITDHFYY